jgi:hypothetical protein
MKLLFLAGLAAAFLTSVLIAGPMDEAIVAAMSLSDRANYSWVCTVNDDARTYDIVGKTSNAGYTQVRMPIINSVRRRLGRGARDNEVEAVFRGNVNCILLTDEGWRTVDELPIVVDTEPILGTNIRVGSGPSRSAILGSGRGGKNIRPAPKVDDERDDRGYSNLQLGVSHPHEELGIIVSTGTDLRAEGDTLSGSLTELGAQLLLVRDGQDDITPLRGAGTFTLWIRAGIVTRYQVELDGILAIKTGLAVKQVQVHQTATTIIRDVGTTTVDVPVEAKQKLGG